MSDKEFVEFNLHDEGELISINVFLEEPEMTKLKDVWFNKVDSCQAPLVDAQKTGLHIHIPWILKGGQEAE